MRSASRSKWPLYELSSVILRVVLWSLCTSIAVADETNSALDEQLLDSIKYRQFEVFEKLLDSGANPNSLYGTGFYDTAMCLAAGVGYEQYLKTLVRYGGDVNLFNPDSPTSGRTPLSCSIFYGNRESFAYLLSAGAKPDVDLCPECDSRFRRSPLEAAVISTRFDMALRLMELVEIDPGEIESIIFVLEHARTRADHFTNDARTELIEWVRAQGYEVNPTTPGRY